MFTMLLEQDRTLKHKNVISFPCHQLKRTEHELCTYVITGSSKAIVRIMVAILDITVAVNIILLRSILAIWRDRL
ncbi:hypothetical protein D3C76_1657290 [compost metagenome]